MLYLYKIVFLVESYLKLDNSLLYLFAQNIRTKKYLFAHIACRCQEKLKKCGGKWGDVVHLLLKWGE